MIVTCATLCKIEIIIKIKIEMKCISWIMWLMFFYFVLKSNLMWKNGVMRKHNEEIYGIEYQRYTKDHLCTNGKVVKGGGGGIYLFFWCI